MHPMEAIRDVMKKEPELTVFGFGIYEDYPERRLNGVVREKEFRIAREELFSRRSVAAFERSCAWLEQIDRSVGFRKGVPGSYGLKHCVERWCELQEAPQYVPMGAFLAAAIHKGFHFKRISNAPNARLNINEHSITERLGAKGI